MKEKLVQEIYENRRSQLERIAARARGTVIDRDTKEYESIGSELPVTSSDHNRWWLDDGKNSTLFSPVVEVFQRSNFEEQVLQPGQT